MPWPMTLRRGVRAGFDEYLTKPIDMQRLVRVLNQQLMGVAV